MPSDDQDALFQKLRNDFPMLKQTMHGKPLVYFDSAATAQKPQVVIDSIAQFYASQYGTVHRAVYELCAASTQSYQQTRELVRDFIGANRSEEIIFTQGTTDSINLAAHSFGKICLNPGDEVLITAMEHHSNIVPWQMICEEKQAILRVVPINERGELVMEELAKLLNKNTRILAMTHISNALGTLNPIKEIIQTAHANNTKVLIDAAQSAPHMPINVQELDCDFLAFSGHKLYGPTGIGILYGKEKLLEQMPPYQGGGDMIESVSFEKTSYNVPPLKFEAGTPMIAEVIGLGQAISYLQKIGMQKVSDREHALLQYATQKMEQIPGIRIIGTAKEKGAIISFEAEKIHPLDIGTMLDLKGIAIRTGHHCAQPVMKYFKVPGTARISFAFYNTFEEIDFFIQSLDEILKKLR